MLHWLGEDVGPKPDDVEHGLIFRKGSIMCVSQELYERIRREFRPISLTAQNPLWETLWEAAKKSAIQIERATPVYVGPASRDR